MEDEQSAIVEEEEEAEPQYKLSAPPKGVEFGSVARCPACKGKGNEKGKAIEFPCPRCNGYGAIPNRGPIP